MFYVTLVTHKLGFSPFIPPPPRSAMNYYCTRMFLEYPKDGFQFFIFLLLLKKFMGVPNA